MIQKHLTRNNILVIATVLISILVIATIVLLSNRPNEGVNLGVDSITEIDLSTKKIDSVDAFGAPKTEAEILAEKPNKQLRLSAGNFNIYGFSRAEGGDKFVGGGCQMTRFDNYLEIDGAYYLASIDNLARAISPETKEEFADLINLDKFINPVFCGNNVLLFDGYQRYVPSLEDPSCTVPNIDVASSLVQEGDTVTFSYFVESIALPFTLRKASLRIEGQNVYPSFTDVFTCETDGLIF